MEAVARGPLRRRARPPLGALLAPARGLVRPLAAAVGLLALALFLVEAPLSLAALALVGAMGGVALLLRPALGLYALAFAVPFGSLREFGVGGVSVGASELLVAAVLGAWAARMAVTRRVDVVRTPLTLAVLGYIGALALGLLPATALTPALKELVKWIEFLVVYTTVASLPDGDEGRRLVRGLVAALLLAGLAEGLLGAYQFLHGVGPPGFILMGRYMRAHGTFQQPNPYGGYLGLLLPLAYGTVLAEWRAAWGAIRAGRPRGAWLWALAGVSGGVMLAGLVMSWSRGALLGLVAGAGIVFLSLGRRAWAALAAAALVLALLGPGSIEALPGDLVGRVTETFAYVALPDLTALEIDDANFSVVERAAHWLAAWRMFSRAPWLGVGTGQYATVYPSVALPRWQDPLGHAHNYYLNVLAEGGLLGLGAYLLMLWVALRAAWRAVGECTGWRRGLALGALGMLGYIAAHSAFDNLYVHEMYLLVATILGLAAWARGREAPETTGVGP